jgi:hypothetical protein
MARDFPAGMPVWELVLASAGLVGLVGDISAWIKCSLLSIFSHYFLGVYLLTLY